MARRADRSCEMRTGLTGRPMSLAEWPAGEELPVASCKHYSAVHATLYEARAWLEQGKTSEHKQV